MHLSHLKNTLPEWLKYSLVVYALSAISWWLVLRSGRAESAWQFLVNLTPGLTALMFGLLKKHHLKYIAWWLGDMRFWLVALALPPFIEMLTAAVAVFLQLAELDSAALSVHPGQAVSKLIRLPLPVGTSPIWIVVINILVNFAVATALYFPFAIAEELGWRGTLHLQCATRYGFLKGAVLTGLIWGIWQASFLTKNEHVSQHSMLGAFAETIVLAVVLSIVLGYLYEQSGSIWIPSLLRASLSAVYGAHHLVLVEKRNAFPIEVLWVGLWVIVAEICLWQWAKSNGRNWPTKSN